MSRTFIKPTLAVLLMASVMTSSGCATRELWPEVAAASATERGRATADAVEGRVVFEGAAPRLEPIDLSSLTECVEAHGGIGTMPDESVMVGADGGLKNVVVYVGGSVPGVRWEPPTAAVVEQRRCRYEPHVLAVLVGQEVRFENKDPFLHNAHPLDPARTSHGFGRMPEAEREAKEWAARPRVYKVKCDVHPWMAMYVAVRDNPFFQVTGANGRFELKGVPAGEYELVAWHETYGEKRQRIAVGDGGDAGNVEFRFSARDAER